MLDSCIGELSKSAQLSVGSGWKKKINGVVSYTPLFRSRLYAFNCECVYVFKLTFLECIHLKTLWSKMNETFSWNSLHGQITSKKLKWLWSKTFEAFSIEGPCKTNLLLLKSYFHNIFQLSILVYPYDSLPSLLHIFVVIYENFFKIQQWNFLCSNSAHSLDLFSLPYVSLLQLQNKLLHKSSPDISSLFEYWYKVYTRNEQVRFDSMWFCRLTCPIPPGVWN